LPHFVANLFNNLGQVSVYAGSVFLFGRVGDFSPEALFLGV
jgi:hypothetical protein